MLTGLQQADPLATDDVFRRGLFYYIWAWYLGGLRELHSRRPELRKSGLRNSERDKITERVGLQPRPEFVKIRQIEFCAKTSVLKGNSFMKLQLPAIALLIGVSGNLLSAHHGSSISYQLDKMITVKGTVTEWQYAYPHPQIYFDVKDDAGNVQHWGSEILPTPIQMSNFHAGWSRNSLKPGDQIVLECNPSKAGTNTCLAKKLTVNGKEMPLENPAPAKEGKK